MGNKEEVIFEMMKNKIKKITSELRSLEQKTNNFEKKLPALDTLEKPSPTKKVSGKLSAPPSHKPTDPLSLYIMEISKYPVLSREEELKWATLYHETKDLQALRTLVKGNLRFVVKIAMEYSKFGTKLIDLIQEGNIGLLKAIKEFNPYKGVRLITYAVWWIRGTIQEYLMRQHSIVRIGTSSKQKKLFYLLRKQNLPEIESTKDIPLLAKNLGISEKEIQSMKTRLTGYDVSLDSSADSSFMLKDVVNVTSTQPDQILQEEQEFKKLRNSVKKLRPKLNSKEVYILDNRTLSATPQTLQQIGNQFGVTRESIRQIETKLLKKIKNQFL